MDDLNSVIDLPIASPTILFVRPSHLTALTRAIIDNAKKTSGFFYALAWRHKLGAILEGFFTKQSLWDRLVFDNARVEVMGKGAGTVRVLVASGGERFLHAFRAMVDLSIGPVETQALTPARIALSVP